MEKVTTATGGEASGGGGFADGSTAVLLGMLMVIIGVEIGGGCGGSAASLDMITHEQEKKTLTTQISLDLPRHRLMRLNPPRRRMIRLDPPQHQLQCKEKKKIEELQK